MGRKKKLTSKSENIVIQKTNGIPLTKEVNFQQESNVKSKTNKIFANICHKKCYGSNNWKAFLEALPNEKGSENKKPPSRIRKPSNKKPIQKNQFNIVSHLSVKHSGELSDLNNLIDKSSSHKTPIENEFNSNKYAELEQGYKLTMQKQSGIEKPVLTKQIAMDCEMVGVEMGVDNNMLARISLVNALGDCIYDKFVKPTEPVLDYRTHISGVRSEDLENAEDFTTVQQKVADILKGRILVGHALKHDLKVLFLSHPNQATRDTSKYKRFREGKTPSLKKLAKKYLGVTIQEGEHSSVTDALAAMQLYRMFKKEWEATVKTNAKMKFKGKKCKNSVK